MTPEQVLSQVLQSCQPGQLLTCGARADAVGQSWAGADDGHGWQQLDPGAPNQAFPLPTKPELALISDTLEAIDHASGETLLGQLRNYGTHRIAVVVADDSGWPFRDFISLGFFRQGPVEADPPATLFTYNIDQYNHRRAWNNPDYWANPEMWGKAWW